MVAARSSFPDPASTPEASASRGRGLEWLDGLTNLEAGDKLTKPTLERMVILTNYLGDPQMAAPAIHITGTNGKGTTATLAAQLLRAAGSRVGLFTSPHISEVNERIVVNGAPINMRTLDARLQVVKEAAADTGMTPTWFEALTLAAFLTFAAENLDVVVIEVGMLGLWDATNVVDAQVAVVTNVAEDHLDVAGGTLAAVAREKAGIVKPGATLILGEQDRTLWQPFLDREPWRVWSLGAEIRVSAARRARVSSRPGSSAHITTPYSARKSVPVASVSRTHVLDAAMAISAAEAMLNGPIRDDLVQQVLTRTTLPGRAEVLSDGPSVIVDGAHNPAAAAALREMLRELRQPGGRLILIFAALAGRNAAEFLGAVGLNEFARVIVTELPHPRSLSVSDLALVLENAGRASTQESRPADALASASAAAGPLDVIVATGSMYLINPIKQAFEGMAKG